jgi:hypothetical protein
LRRYIPREVCHLIYRAVVFSILWHILAFPAAWIGLHPFNIVPLLKVMEASNYPEFQAMLVIRGTWFLGLFITFLVSSSLADLILQNFKFNNPTLAEHISTVCISALLIAVVFIPSEPRYVPDIMSYSIGLILLFSSFAISFAMSQWVYNKSLKQDK